jgi:hypothetical protein
MSNVVNWKKIAAFAVAIFLAEVLVGFIDGGLVTGASLDAAMQRLAIGTLLSLCFSILLFSVMASRQDHRPFLHAILVLLLTFAFSLALGAILPAWLTGTPLILVALEWLTLVVGLVIGTSIGRYVRLRRVRADA